MAKTPKTTEPEPEVETASAGPRILVQAEGRTVLQEDGQTWPVEGLEDPDTLFTRRRFQDRDLVVKIDQPEGDTE